jgi:hypothetical protein
MLKKSFPYIIIAALLAFIFLNDCSNAPTVKPQIITTPKIEAKFDPGKPIHTPVNFGQKVSKNDKSKNTLIPAPIIIQNDSLLKSYQRENDLLKKELLFKKAIQLNKFDTKFEDENLIININGIVQGEVQEITPSYVIKPQTIEVQPKEVKFRLLAGMEVGNNLEFNKPLFKANVGFQNAKGSILTASYDTEQRIFIGYHFTVFKIRR